MAAKLILSLSICRLIVAVGLILGPAELFRLGFDHPRLSLDESDLESASRDFGLMSRSRPRVVFRPRLAEDVARVVRASFDSPQGGFPVSAMGHAHSINGQAHAANGVVIRMGEGCVGVPAVSEAGRYVDAWGGELWIDVLRRTLEHGLAPKSWTDYLYLSVGGTLSNAGISGQAFNHGPQISNVLELDVVTGKGDVVTCSQEKDSRLFHAVLGGLGQFGIITRARIALEPAPQRVRWIRVLYSNFTSFTGDQEHLISLHGRPATEKFDYVEGFVIVDQGLINNWRSSFFSPLNPVKISSLGASSGDGALYCIEVTMNYNDSAADSIDQKVEDLLKDLNFIPTTVFTTDLPYIDFLDRVHKAELKLRSKNLWEVSHPWLNLFVPRSRIADFDEGVFKGILGNKTSGPILIYPTNRDKWDRESSVVIPDEDVFYLVALLRSALEDGDETQTLDYLTNQNQRILNFCREQGIPVKQYLPHYTTTEEWRDHFGEKWERFRENKMEYDPRHILSTGQRIFETRFVRRTTSSW
ncbi:hypothetical protein MLD38_002108 [Melastoma candidum]|uniref:Uncharacterized protein n=1 Tax=Melastoma candidum TaxID=119954 RepID=A0ACB9SKB4_9MYRT|nr:hypothetical protein MLD38_002108 [Melastoma candidum]